MLRPLIALGMACLAVMALSAQSHAVQQRAYSVRRIHQSPGASSIIGTGLNNRGHVVGWSQFFGSPPVLRSWIWTPETGLTFLTPPAGQSLLRAMDVNDADVITGDGGYDTGVAWRYTSGVFELLGVLPGGDTVSTAGGINEHGDIAGASRDGSSFLVPPSAFLSKPGQPLVEVYATGTGAAINDAGQIVGYSSNNLAFRYTPASGVQLLGSLGTYDLNWAWGINSAGDVVGEAVESNSQHYEPVPFLYTNAGGMQKIGNFGGYAAAVSINDAGQVVGNYFAPALPFTYSWVWSAHTGVQFLKDLIDPAEHLNLLRVARINDSGQILCQAVDNQTGDHVVAILTQILAPVTYCTAKAGLTCGTPAIQWSGSPVAGASSGFVASAAPARALKAGLLIYTTDGRANLPFDGGTLCIAPSPLKRSTGIDSGGTPGSCDGVFTLDFNAFASGALGGNPLLELQVPGTRVNAQFWGRDAQATGSFLSDALEFVMH